MGGKLVSLLKKTSIFITIIIVFNIYVEAASEKDNFSLKVISATDDLSLKKEAKIYSVNANKNGISIKSSRIDFPKRNSLRIFDTPSRNDKYVIKILDKDLNAIRILGLKNPFYIHVQHMDFEDRYIFGGNIDRNFDIPIPIDSDAAFISFNEQNEIGLQEINRISIE